MSKPRKVGHGQARQGGWSPRLRFEAALRGEMPDRVPFAIWNNKLPGGAIDAALLEAGTCVVVKSALYDTVLDGVRIETEHWSGEDGFPRRRTVYHTPAGAISLVEVLRPNTTWVEVPPFKSAADYDPLLALVASRRLSPCYERFLADDTSYGASGIARPATEATPMHEIVYRLLGVENFSVEWFEHRDHVLALYNALLVKRRQAIALAAASPAYHVTAEANISVDIVGVNRFQRYYLPPLREACEELHAAGKLVGAHLDGKNRLLAPYIAPIDLDYIESFTPPPDCDLSITEARRLWPGKSLYVNFPSSVHLQGTAAVCAKARELLGEGAPGNGLILGVLEDIPGSETLVPLARAVRDAGQTPIGM